MGYITKFTGHFTLNPVLTKTQVQYLLKFSNTKHIKHDPIELQRKYQGSFSLNGNYGIDGEFFVGPIPKETIDLHPPHHLPIQQVQSPSTQPNYWCHWVVSSDGSSLMWDGRENFYDYVAWLKYLISKFFNPWNIKLTGSIKYQGQYHNDKGIISIINNEVKYESNIPNN